MKIHDLKCHADAFDRIHDGVKRAEVRLNDRPYEEGDLIVLRRTSTGDVAAPGEFVVDEEAPVEMVRITDVFPGGQYGIAEGYVLLSFERILLKAAED